MHHETINAHEVISRFLHFIEPNSEFRVIRLLGDAKMGKSHLMTKVFPGLCQQYSQYCCAVIDLRHPTQTVPDFLHSACAQLSRSITFPTYFAAHDEWIKRPIIHIKGLQSLLSRITVSYSHNSNDSWSAARHL